MRTRSGSLPWLGPLALGAVLACALAAPDSAAAALDGDDGKKGKKGKKGDEDDGKKGDEAQADEAQDDGAQAEAESEASDEASDDGASADASVSTRGAAAGAGGKKGQPMKGRFGVGALRTVSGLNALYGRYYLANRVTLGLTAGFATFSHRETDDTGEFGRVRTVGAVAVGPELFFWPVQGPRSQQVHADFGIGGRVVSYIGVLGIPREERSNTLDTPLEIDVEIPAKIQLFIGRRVSINPEFGLAVRIIPGSREADQNGDSDQNPGTGIGGRLGTDDGPGLGFELGNHAGFFMGIGVGYYFGKLRQ
ncbi:MAG: hypothetical protein KDK70_09130 [Myxococcales bacterium]|nr:hypothetical protein [Myxococcales bacterium]